ncbi:MAG: helix-turn-helix transcriptional regulator [Chloroflexi bacterium]|nr:helix-turn-helix transcriptional regulator [Chloroflexota bacterium]
MGRRRASQRVLLKPEAVWEHINRRNLSQNELARKCGISSGYLSQLITGTRSPSAEVRRRLQSELGAEHFDDLFVLQRSQE